MLQVYISPVAWLKSLIGFVKSHPLQRQEPWNDWFQWQYFHCPERAVFHCEQVRLRQSILTVASQWKGILKTSMGGKERIFAYRNLKIEKSLTPLSLADTMDSQDWASSLHQNNFKKETSLWGRFLSPGSIRNGCFLSPVRHQSLWNRPSLSIDERYYKGKKQCNILSVTILSTDEPPSGIYARQSFVSKMLLWTAACTYFQLRAHR